MIFDVPSPSLKRILTLVMPEISEKQSDSPVLLQGRDFLSSTLGECFGGVGEDSETGRLYAMSQIACQFLSQIICHLTAISYKCTLYEKTNPKMNSSPLPHRENAVELKTQ